MPKRALLLLLLVAGCTGRGVLGGGPGMGGAGGTAAGGSGAGGAATCAGTAGFSCVTDCNSDFLMNPTCAGGEWSCPGFTVQTNNCGCVGFQPPDSVCRDHKWVRVDGGAGGSGGLGGAGGDGGARGGAGGGAGGATGQGGRGGQGTDAGADAGTDAATCSGTAAGFACLIGSCSNDVAMPATCRSGFWACPPGTVDTRSCNGCTGNPPPGWVCLDGRWQNADAGSGG